MAQLYSIKEETLTAIGDVLREKYGETVLKTIDVNVGLAYASGATGFNETGMMTIGYKQLINFYFPGAVKIEIKAGNAVHQSADFGYLYYALGGEYTEDTFPTDDSHLFPKSTSSYHIYTYENEERVSIYGKGGTIIAPWGYYMEVIGLDENGYSIPAENTVIQQQEREVKKYYSSADIAPAIAPMTFVAPWVIEGNAESMFSTKAAQRYLRLFGDTTSTKDITQMNYMFRFCGSFEKIPFEINVKHQDGSNYSIDGMFSCCYKLKELPKINGTVRPNDMNDVFNGCYMLRTIPENYFDNWDLSMCYDGNYDNVNDNFTDCYSLRSIPSSFLKRLYSNSTYSSYSPYGNFNYCYSLDAINGMAIQPNTITSNMFGSAFQQLNHVKSITFDVNNDGSAKTANWKSQTIEFSVYTGYANSPDRILNYNSGITADKEVKDDATYQALKNDTDWFSLDVNYSRYNHDSAVETINSLPDTSAYLATAGGTNTIKFNGTSGAKTDGGAINTMTEEEIAVATAKGWVVSFV